MEHYHLILSILVYPCLSLSHMIFTCLSIQELLCFFPFLTTEKSALPSALLPHSGFHFTTLVHGEDALRSCNSVLKTCVSLSTYNC